ncbi:MAG: hypothetical protein ACLPPF_15075 [Rhodomicrobium sp.]
MERVSTAGSLRYYVPMALELCGEYVMRMLIALAATIVLAGFAQADQEPDRTPILRIEAGMHTAPIFSVGVDKSCSLIVTGSYDKTVRLWSLPQGGVGTPHLWQVLRVPVGDGDEGKINAVAITPDGKWTAAGGIDAVSSQEKVHSVYIFETATGRLFTRIGHLAGSVQHLAFSPDGTKLVATLGSGAGIRLWSTAGWQVIAEDKNYGGKTAAWAAFDSGGTLYTVAFDGQIRRYAPNGQLVAKGGIVGSKEPYSVSVHPHNDELAIGLFDKTGVEVYDAQSLKPLYAANIKNIDAVNLASVAWSSGGRTLYASGQVSGEKSLFVWQDEGRGRRTDLPVSKDSIFHLVPCRNDMVAGAADPAFGVIGPDGAKRVWQEGVTADMRDKTGDAFTLSANAKRIRFGLDAGKDPPVLFDLAGLRLSGARTIPAGLAAPEISGLAVKDWNYNTAPKLNGQLIGLDDDERALALAIAPDNSRFVLGTMYWLRAYSAGGSLLWKKAGPGSVWGVNISGDGRILAVAYRDGTIRWHRLSDGKELLALFVHAKDHRFIAWTPKGYYAATPGGEDLIGWHINRDFDHAPDFFPVSRFKEYNRPDIVKRALDDLDEDRTIAEADRIAGVKTAQDIYKSLPPVAAILSPVEGASFAGGSLTVRYSLRSPSGSDILEVAALADGRPLPGGSSAGVSGISALNEIERTLTLTGLPARDFTLSLVARTATRESTPTAVQLKFGGANKKAAPGSLSDLVNKGQSTPEAPKGGAPGSLSDLVNRSLGAPEAPAPKR